jgi:hypothetical protein
VRRVIVTGTDHDFMDVAVRPDAAGVASSGRWGRVASRIGATLAGVALVATDMRIGRIR